MKFINEGVLFPEFDSQNTNQRFSSHFEGKDRFDRREKKIHNLHRLNNFETEGIENLPKVKPYRGDIPLDIVPFSRRKQSLFSFGVHCFLYDYKFEQIWNDPSKSVSDLRRFHSVISPDFSIFVDLPRAVNVWNLYRNRWISCFWQENSVNVIHSTSWGNVDSFEYCFDGLPEKSVIAIGHSAIGRDKSYRKLFRLGVNELVQRKNPERLIVYGYELDFNPGVEIQYYENNIQKLRKL